MKQLPPRLDEALEVGCGTGAFARLLAERCGTVLAIDLSPRMVEVARERSWGHPNVECVATPTTPLARYGAPARWSLGEPT